MDIRGYWAVVFARSVRSTRCSAHLPLEAGQGQLRPLAAWACTLDMPTIMEILRHTQISQTRRYVKGRSHLTKDAMRRMGDTFLPAPAPTSEPATETGIETGGRRAARARRRRRIRQKQKPQVTASESWGFHRAAFGIRTRDLRITSALLWPTELRRHAVCTMVRSAATPSLHSFEGWSVHVPLGGLWAGQEHFLCAAGGVPSRR